MLAPIARAANTPSWVVQHRQRARYPGPALAVLLAFQNRKATAVENSGRSESSRSWRRHRAVRGLWTLRRMQTPNGPSGAPVLSGLERALQRTNAGVRLYGVPARSVYKGELATNASQSAPPSAMNVTGARPVTNTGAISPSTTNVSTTQYSRRHSTPGDSTPRDGCAAGPSEGGRNSPYRRNRTRPAPSVRLPEGVSQGASLRWQRP